MRLLGTVAVGSLVEPMQKKKKRIRLAATDFFAKNNLYVEST